MAKIGWGWLVTGWRRFLLAGAGLLIIALVVIAVFGKDIRLSRMLSGFEEDRQATMDEIRLLDLPYRDAIRRAMLRGGRILTYQGDLCDVLLGAPFYDRATVTQALAEDDPVVRRAAAMSLLRHGVSKPPVTVPDDILEVIRDWAKEPTAMWLDAGLAYLMFYRDPRLVGILLPLLDAPPTPEGDDLHAIARSNAARDLAARTLAPYLEEPGVIDTMKRVMKRDNEAKMVKMGVISSLARGGFADDIEVYKMAAESEDPHIRQTLADNLEDVRDPRVIPILEELTADSFENVRRGAVISLARKRAPFVMGEIHYLAEDWYASIKGDLAAAVRDYRRQDLLPFVIWCLLDYEPAVVQKAVETLALMTKKSHGFSWEEYKRKDVLERIQLTKDFMNDEEGKKAAIEKWVEDYPPRYTDRDRIPHLIRQLGHADRRNVRRAIRELAKIITERKDVLPPAVIDPNADVQAADDALTKFIREDSEKAIADLTDWWESERKK